MQFQTNMQPTPSVFNEGFSWYETVGKLLYQVNVLIDNTNSNNSEISLLKTYKEAIDDYLSTSGNFTGTWNGLSMQSSDLGLATDWNNAKGVFETVTARLNNGDVRIEDLESMFNGLSVVNVKDFGAVGDGVTDDTTEIQNAINSLTSGSILLFPKGSYSVTTLTMNGKDNVKVFGHGATIYGDDSTKNILNMTDVEFIFFEGLKVNFRNKPSLYSLDYGVSIKILDYNTIVFDKCVFDGIACHGIYADNAKDNFGATGGTTSQAIIVDKCYFINQMSPTVANYASYSAIGLGENGEYATITFNQFRKCWHAIRGVGGANALVQGNTIMSCNGDFRVDGALIYFSNSSSNSAKVKILDNNINHNNGGANCISCIGDLLRNESRYTIRGNHMLVNGTADNHRGIYVGNSFCSVVTDNYVSTYSGTLVGIVQACITVENGTRVLVDNNTCQYSVALRLLTSTVIVGRNILEDPATGVTETIAKDSLSKVIPKSGTYTYRIDGAGNLSAECENNYWTVVKNGTGDYTISHSFGHTDYVVDCVADNVTTPYVFSVVRTTNDIRIRVFNLSGVATDTNVMGSIQTTMKNILNI